MFFRKKNPIALPPRPDDLEEARQSRQEDQQKLEKLNAQANYVARISDRLVEARRHDLFGDQLQDTFTRKGVYR